MYLRTTVGVLYTEHSFHFHNYHWTSPANTSSDDDSCQNFGSKINYWLVKLCVSVPDHIGFLEFPTPTDRHSIRVSKDALDRSHPH